MRRIVRDQADDSFGRFSPEGQAGPCPVRLLRLAALAVLLIATVPTAWAQAPRAPQPQPARPAPAAAQAQPVNPASAGEMDAILQQWEQRSQSDQTLYAKFSRTDVTSNPGFGPEIVKFEGVALLRAPNLACIEFSKVQPPPAAGKPAPEPVFHERIVCTGENVYHFYAPTKEVFVYPLDKDQRKRSIEEGPLPFLFNMRAADAKRRYFIELLEKRPMKDKQPGAIIRIIPRIDVDKGEFSQAIVLLNLATYLPEALQLYSPNGKDKKTYVFSTVERNGTNDPATNPNNYNGARMAEDFRKSGYKVLVNPSPQPNQAARPGVGAAPAPRPTPAPAPAQPAMRPRTGAVAPR